ncbi:hypothetical protein N7468_010689 [Penicillium chermesinum]|uniref:Uncharacterized protein n=1 Tax=Penicillium chermesinum TaxID=63820 RepID=A0A9W9N850_9EURO|nr:uncharacterized protein N7468_010689 [Penicillium chermesinum]KAJ5215010.1 hypothetical protein N7468_010689 [Penicillium chermesinum]KAJ6141490.1 hypothetical protein N7470_009880 [Penicillium chermesinum]
MRLSRSSGIAVGSAFLATLSSAAQVTTTLTKNAQDLFDWSMHVNDLRWDDSYKYIWYADNGPWSTRFTAWYVAGLLYRNEGADVANAKAAIENLITCQLTEDYESAWYGTFKLSPDEPYPTPDSDLYPPDIYNTYDPNWREFIGTQLVQVVEEFSDLLGTSLVSRIEDTLEIAAVGSMRRNGTFPEGDNLTPAYSNPTLMRAWYVSWIGKRRHNETLINYADEQANTVLALFKSTGSNVLSEYNAPTYYGMDIWALAGAIKYGPPTAQMTTNAKLILTDLWEDIAAHYNSYLGNMAGPYDRAYTRDMVTHSAVIDYFWWGLYGYGHGPQPNKLEADLLYDVAQGAALALVVDVVADHISAKNAEWLSTNKYWEGERLITKKVPDSLVHDAEARVVTSWISAPLMIGAEQVNETVNRGEQYVPAIVQWAGDKDHTPFPYMTYFSLYPTASTINAVAGPNSLEISYPNITQDGTDIFTFVLAEVPPSWTLTKKNVISGLDNLPCLEVNLTADGLVKQPVVYGATVEDDRVYNISYTVPVGFTGTPKVTFTFRYTC